MLHHARFMFAFLNIQIILHCFLIISSQTLHIGLGEGTLPAELPKRKIDLQYMDFQYVIYDVSQRFI